MKKWVAILKNGETVSEDDTNWSNIQNDVTDLWFENNGQIIALPKLDSYIQAKTASANLDGSGIQIESRYIGGKLGNNTIIIRINETTNNINLEIK